MATETEVKDNRFTPVVLNEIDDPKNLSVTSVGVLPESVDNINKDGVDLKKSEIVEKEKAETPEAKETETEKKDDKSEEFLGEPTEKDPPWYRKRFNEITKKRREAENALEIERSKRLLIEEELENLKNKAPITGKPKQEDFTTEEEYIEALTDWKIDHKLQVSKEKTLRENEQNIQEQIFLKNKNLLTEKISEVEKKYRGTEDILTSEDFQISDYMIDAIMLSDKSVEIFNYLAKNPDISSDISSLHPLAAAREIGKIEEKLNIPPPRKKTTSAPEPINPIKTFGSVDKDPEKMSMSEYRAWRANKK